MRYISLHNRDGSEVGYVFAADDVLSIREAAAQLVDRHEDDVSLRIDDKRLIRDKIGDSAVRFDATVRLKGGLEVRVSGVPEFRLDPERASYMEHLAADFAKAGDANRRRRAELDRRNGVRSSPTRTPTRSTGRVTWNGQVDRHGVMRYTLTGCETRAEAEQAVAHAAARSRAWVDQLTHAGSVAYELRDGTRGTISYTPKRRPGGH